MVTISDFTNEERILYSGIISRIHKMTVMSSLAQVFFVAREQTAMNFSRMCMDFLIEAGVTSEIAEKTPLSKYVWENMDKEKQAYVLEKIQKIYLGPSSCVGAAAMTAIHKILFELDVRPFSGDDKGIHFPTYGLI